MLGCSLCATLCAMALDALRPLILTEVLWQTLLYLVSQMTVMRLRQAFFLPSATCSIVALSQLFSLETVSLSVHSVNRHSLKEKHASHYPRCRVPPSPLFYIKAKYLSGVKQSQEHHCLQHVISLIIGLENPGGDATSIQGMLGKGSSMDGKQHWEYVNKTNGSKG